MKGVIKVTALLLSIVMYEGCDLASNQEFVTIDGVELDKRFYDSQAIDSNDSDKTKELKNLLLNKKLYRVYPYPYEPNVTKFSNYFDKSGAQKSANIINNKEQDISFEQFVIKDYHISIEYYKTIECDFVGVEDDIITLKCTDGTWNFAPTLEKAEYKMSSCDID